MKVTVVAITIRCGDSYSSALALKRSSPGCYLTCRNMVLTVWSFIAPHFFPSYFSLARPFCLIYFPPVSFLSSFLIFLLSLSLSHSTCLVCGSLSVTGASDASARERTTRFQLLTPSSLAYLAANSRSSWETYPACQKTNV